NDAYRATKWKGGRSRELLYTSITRARSALHVSGSAEVIAAALGRHAGRVSGLGGGWVIATLALRSVKYAFR
ncbi:MAG: hypothetical protein EOO38_27790, partial [Cytophagaceae bacterium]